MGSSPTPTYRSSHRGGLARELLDDPMSAMTEIAAMRAPIVKGRAGLLPVCFVVDPALARQVLQTDQKTFRRNPLVNHLFKAASGENLFTASGSAWKWRRALVGQPFRQEALRRDLPEMIEAVNAEVVSWPADTAVDPQVLCMDTALNVAAKMMFSTTLDPATARGLRQAMDGVVDWITHRMEHPAAAPLLVPTAANRQFRQSRKQAREIIGGLVGQRRREPTASSDLLDDLIAAVDPSTGQTLTDGQLVDELVVLLFAGHETTASAAAWTIELLARHPDIQDRARQEVADATQGEPIAPQHIPKLHYVAASIEETLRLYPPAWGIPRMAYRTARIGEASIRPFTPTIVALAAMHRSPDHWDNPDDFKPERFLTEEDTTAHQPFGLGPRRCIGARFATQELIITIATLLHQRQITPSATQPATPHAVFALRAKDSRVHLSCTASEPAILSSTQD